MDASLAAGARRALENAEKVRAESSLGAKSNYAPLFGLPSCRRGLSPFKAFFVKATTGSGWSSLKGEIGGRST